MAAVARKAYDEWREKHGGERPDNRDSKHVLIERWRVADEGGLDLLPICPVA